MFHGYPTEGKGAYVHDSKLKQIDATSQMLLPLLGFFQRIEKCL